MPLNTVHLNVLYQALCKLTFCEHLNAHEINDNNYYCNTEIEMTINTRYINITKLYMGKDETCETSEQIQEPTRRSDLMDDYLQTLYYRLISKSHY